MHACCHFSRVWLSATLWTSILGILQARILEWVAVPSSRGSSQPEDQTPPGCKRLLYLLRWYAGSLPLVPPRVMLPKAHLTSHSRISGYRWGTTTWWLSGSTRSFLYNSPVHSFHLFLISSASVRSLPFLTFRIPILAWNVPLVSPITFNRSLIFPIQLFSFISLHCSLKKAFLCLLANLWNSAFSWVYPSFSLLSSISLLFSAICKVFLDNHFIFLHFFFGDGFGHCLLYNVMNLCQ